MSDSAKAEMTIDPDDAERAFPAFWAEAVLNAMREGVLFTSLDREIARPVFVCGYLKGAQAAIEASNRFLETIASRTRNAGEAQL